VHPGCEMSTHYFHAQVGLFWIQQKVRRDTIRQTCVFASSGILVTYCIIVHPGHEMPTHNFSCSGGPSADPTKSAPRQFTVNLSFASTGIYGSRSAFRCVRDAKHQRTFFMIGRARFGSHKKPCRDLLCGTCVFSIQWELQVT
jgi:hypothetical protein